jgi:hypothetical protein
MAASGFAGTVPVLYLPVIIVGETAEGRPTNERRASRSKYFVNIPENLIEDFAACLNDTGAKKFFNYSQELLSPPPQQQDEQPQAE